MTGWGSKAAVALTILSALGLALGVLLIAQLGGTSGADLGRGAAPVHFAKVVPLLIAAEIVKILTCVAQIILVRAVAGLTTAPSGMLARLGGYAGAMLIAASGLAGLWAIASKNAGLGGIISGLGFVGLAATGLFVLLLTTAHRGKFGRWRAMAGFAFAAVSIAALLLPPLAMISAVIGWVWWLSLASVLRRPQGERFATASAVGK